MYTDAFIIFDRQHNNYEDKTQKHDYYIFILYYKFFWNFIHIGI